MLIRFNVKNFLSFDVREDGKTEEFSMLAGKVRSKRNHVYKNDDIKLLKFSAVYGANAAGKSNLVKAINFLRNTILKGLEVSSINKYCKFKAENKNKSSYFEIELMLDDKYYSYGFEAVLSNNQLISEWLFELFPNGEERPIFLRDIEKHTHEIGKMFDEHTTEKLEGYVNDIDGDDSILLLKAMNQNKRNLYKDTTYETLKVFQKIYKWIESDLIITYPDRPISDFSYMFEEENISNIQEIISFFATGITSFKFEETTEDEMLQDLPNKFKEELLNDIINFHKKVNKEIKKEMEEQKNSRFVFSKGMLFRNRKEFYILIFEDEKVKYQVLKFIHKGSNETFNLFEESDGTARLLDLLEILLPNDGKTYIIDELDRCLHPILTYKFVELFFKMAKSKMVQLIVTTHESRLLDFDLLRRDEIWFIKKNKAGSSHIYSLEEYNEHFDKKIDKAYLEGRYGGVPIFSTIFPIKG